MVGAGIHMLRLIYNRAGQGFNVAGCCVGIIIRKLDSL